MSTNIPQCSLTVKTKQIYPSHTDSLEESFQGKISNKNGSIYIIYAEEDLDSNTKVTNQIKVSKDGSVSIRRMGGHRSLLHFTMNQPYSTPYNTGYGIMQLTFDPIVIECNETSFGYKLNLQYDIYMGDEKLSCNHYSLEARF